MSRKLLSNKFVLIALVALGILLPLGMIGDLVRERAGFHEAAVADMARSSTASQRITGPVLRLPCTATSVVASDEQTADGSRERTRTEDCSGYALPDLLEVDGVMSTETRRRGIHAARFYRNALAVRARFTVPPSFGTGTPATTLEFGDATLNLGIADPRGIGRLPAARVGQHEIAFAPGSDLAVLGPGIHAALGRVQPGATIDVSFTLELRGHQRFELVPVARTNTVRLSSGWPHPSFVGDFLPLSRDIDGSGFRAEWGVANFATGLEEVFARHAFDAAPCADIGARAFGVALVDPVDVYTQADRAVKYGFLFVTLTFIALLGTEVARTLRLHPLQYTMVGVALAMFFLLLLSLAEHLGFRLAYVIAAGACVTLLATYLGAITASRAVGGVFGITLAALYALLYGILAMEDYALLSGSVFVFGVLAALMLATRHVDFYAVAERLRGQVGAEQGAGGS